MLFLCPNNLAEKIKLAVEVFVGPFGSVVNASNVIDFDSATHDVTVCN